jgi:hypothetical protein
LSVNAAAEKEACRLREEAASGRAALLAAILAHTKANAAADKAAHHVLRQQAAQRLEATAQ